MSACTYLKIGFGYPTTGHNKTAEVSFGNDRIFPKVLSPINFGAILLVGSETNQQN